MDAPEDQAAKLKNELTSIINKYEKINDREISKIVRRLKIIREDESIWLKAIKVGNYLVIADKIRRLIVYLHDKLDNFLD
jgi:hypothetical protein